MRGLEVSVIGAGIAGLAAASALATRGASVVVFEQASSIRADGAGIQISPNGMRVLEALGLAGALRAGAVCATAVSLREHRSGAEVARLDLSARPGGSDHYFVHRADLISLLYAHARACGVRFRSGCRVQQVRLGARAALQFANGATEPADLVVGADGVHSILRPALNGACEPRFSGQVAWRAIVPNVTDQGAQARVYMGPGRHIVCYPLRGGRVLNLVAVEERRAWSAEGWHHVGDADQLRAGFSPFGGDVAQMLKQVAAPNLWGLFLHPVARRWHDAAAVLIGDAAHPTLPFLAQGANLALEDAWCLAESVDRRLAEGEALSQGLADFQTWRRDRCSRVVAAATGTTWKYHLRPGPVRFAAHAVLRVMSRYAPEHLVGQFDWIHGVDVTRAAAPS